MNIFEILIFIILFIALMAERTTKQENSIFINILSFALAGLATASILVKGYRWQMIPVYIVIALYLLLNIIRLFTRRRFRIKNRIARGLFAAISLLVYLFAFIFPALLPIVDLPEPSGEYDVGKTSFRLIDNSRDEIYTQDENDCRNILVTAWYPADIDESMQVNMYWDEKGITGRAYSENSGMGSFWYSHLALSKTNSYIDAAVSNKEKSYPIIIYSHSFYGLNTENTILFEKLASNGYVVFSIAHSYETIASIYPDGEVVYGNLEHFNKIYDDNYEKEERLYEEYENAKNRESKQKIIEEILLVDDQSTQTIKIRTEDAIFLLDELDKMNKEDVIFKTKLDLENIGVVGWSFGGATAGEAGISDSRIKAIVNMDGWPYGELFAKNDINKPYMLMQSDSDDEMEDAVGNLIYSKLKNDAYRLKIQNSTHINFWDFPWFLNIYKYIGYWGSLDAKTMNDIHEAYMLSFFDKYLKHKDINIFADNKDMFSEVEIEHKSK